MRMGLMGQPCAKSMKYQTEFRRCKGYAVWYKLPPDTRPAMNETCVTVLASLSERSAVIMVPTSPRISWIRDTPSTPNCAKDRKVPERAI